MNADHDERGHSLVLNAVKRGPDQPQTDNSRLFMKAWGRLFPKSKSQLKTVISYLKRLIITDFSCKHDGDFYPTIKVEDHDLTP